MGKILPELSINDLAPLMAKLRGFQGKNTPRGGQLRSSAHEDWQEELGEPGRLKRRAGRADVDDCGAKAAACRGQVDGAGASRKPTEDDFT